MKRRLFIIICLLQCLIVKSQSQYQCHYWFDHELPQTVTATFTSNTAQMELDAGSLADGIHTLFVALEGDGLDATRSYVFFKKTDQVSPVNPENVTYHCWFDQDIEHEQTGSFGTGQFIMDAGWLESGFHILHVALEYEEMSSAQHYFFYIEPERIDATTPEEVTYHCWFDQDLEHMQTGPFGTGSILVDAEALADGIHTLFLALEGNGLDATRSYVFFKKTDQVSPVDPVNVTYHCWFDQDYEHEQTGSFGTGQFILDADGLKEGIHTLHVTLDYEGLSSTQNYKFYVVPEQIDPSNPENVYYHCWFDEDFEHEITGPFGVGIVMMNARLLDDGEHTVNIMLDHGILTATQSYLFENHYVPGLMVATTDNILCTVTQDEPKTDSILLRNNSGVALTNIQVTTLTAPNGCTVSSMPFDLGIMEEGYLVYTVVGTEQTQGNYYELLRLKAMSDEGGETVIPIWYYCEEAKPLLEAIPGTLNTSVIFGRTKVVDVMLVNNGNTETGTLTVYPNEFTYWISPIGGDTMASIAPHDTAYISLRFALGNDFAPNPNPYQCYQYILSERGDDVGFFIKFTVIDDPLGSIVIDVTDDFTWNGTRTDDPHVGNAEVVVKGYHSLELMGQGFTNSQGLFQLDDLEEGYYRITVSADDHHTEYEGIINVHGGENTPKTVYLQYLPVAYSWNVSPTGNVNEYTYELDINYESNVPVPVITIDHSGVQELPYGASANFDITVINHGLIDAYDTHLYFSESSEYVFLPLYDIIDTIAPNDTIVIPGVYYRTNNQSIYSADDCDVHIKAISMYYTNGHETGQTLVQNRSLPFDLGNYSVCQPSANSLNNGIPSHNYQPDAPFSSYYVDDGEVSGSFVVMEQFGNTGSSVRMQLSQINAMVCEPYNETFVIHNGHDTNPMTNISLEFNVKDEGGNDCSNLFQISSTLQQITGIDGNGTIEPGVDGTVKVQCVPSRQAVQNGSKVYYCGGTLSFSDPYTSTLIVHELYSAPITITPGPDLYVDYFMPRHIVADDTTTLKIERSEIAELGVIIHNKGGRIAENVTLETATPTVYNYWNDNGNPFVLKNVMFNGSLRSLGMMEVPFGNVDMAKTSVGEWRFASKQLGMFIDYHANVIHNSSYGNSDLSLVSHNGLHELVHPIYAYGDLDDGINDFLINGDHDINGIPDSIYFSQGGTTVVDMVDNITFDHYVEPHDTIVILTLNPSRVGWNYGVTDDPGRDKYELMSCTRNLDSLEIPLNNVWQSFVSFTDDPNPVYENKLHIVDTLSNSASDYTYTLVYRLKADLLDIVEITGIPQDTIDYPLQSFTVQFNKNVIDTTFTYEDMTLTCNNGSNLLDSSVVITMIDSMHFEVNISNFTINPGLYVLTVNTLHIKDNVGYEGYNSKRVTWNQVWTDYTQTDDLTAGWNWWSSFVDMSTEQDFDKLKTALGDNATMIKSRNNGFVSYYGGWYGTLTSLNNSEMYMINMNNDHEISISGPLADMTNTVVDLNQGWNWIGYPLHGDQNINAALANLTASENDLIKSRNAFASYYPSLGWVGTLTNLIPGEGYMYNYTGDAPTSFNYAAPSKVVRHPKVKGTSHWEVSVGEYDMNATLIGAIEIDGEEQHEASLVVGAFIGDRCVGQTNALYVEGINRYLVFLTYYGNEHNEITFRLYDESIGLEYGLSETTVLFAANSSLGTVHEPMIIEFQTMMDIFESYPKSVTIFPNPVKSGEKVRITLNEGQTAGTEVEILSSFGVSLYKTIARGVALELSVPMTSGVYFIMITSKEGYTSYGKMIVE